MRWELWRVRRNWEQGKGLLAFLQTFKYPCKMDPAPSKEKLPLQFRQGNISSKQIL